MRGLTPREREILRLMSLHTAPTGERVLTVPDDGVEAVLRDLTSQGRVHCWWERYEDGLHERWSISLQGLDALRLVPEMIPEVA